MTSRQRNLIKDLVKKYSKNSGTESLIGSVASTNGLLDACQAIIKDVDAKHGSEFDWLQHLCENKNVLVSSFLQDISHIVTLINPEKNCDDQLVILGLSAGASSDEIKRAFRKLSLRYHPDTALASENDAQEMFVKITKAYHALIGDEQKDEKKENNRSLKQWKAKINKQASPRQRKKLFIWGVGLFAILIIFTALSTVKYRRQAMLEGLQSRQGAFVSPTTNAEPKNLIEKPTIIEEKDATRVQAQPQHIIDHGGVEDEAVSYHSESSAIGIKSALLTKDEKEQLPAAPKTDLFLNHQKSDEEKKHKVEQDDTPIPKEKSEKKISTSFSKNQSLLSAAPKKPDNFVANNPQEAIPSSSDRRIENAAENVNSKPVQENKTKNEKDSRKDSLESSAKEEKQQITVDLITPNNTSKESTEETGIQTRLRTFLNEYVKAYEQRNLILFARFFEVDAVENGKPFVAMMPTYLDLFATTSDLSLGIEIISWALDADSVIVEGRFKIHLKYNDSREMSRAGIINFFLTDNNGDFRVSNMDYKFDTGK